MAIRYQHVADELRRMIKAGEFPQESRLPNEDDLSVTFGVGVPTLRRALDVLQDEGMIEKQHGRGNFVRQPRQRITYISGRHLPVARTDDADLHMDTVSVKTVHAGGDLAALLRVPLTTRLAEYVYLGKHQDSPRVLAHVYVPLDEDFNPLGKKCSLWCIGPSGQLGISGAGFAESAERVSARFPTPGEALALRITPRTSVLAIERTSTDASGRVVEAALLVLPGEAEAVFVTSEPIVRKVN